MKFSTRVQYAARAVYYLAGEYGKGAIALHKISDGEGISIKYLGNIMRLLVAAGIVKSENGKNGGFSLARPPQEITLEEVMTATEGSFAPVRCIKGPEACAQYEKCGVSDAWRSLGKVVISHLKSINFKDMTGRQKPGATEKEDWNYY